MRIFFYVCVLSLVFSVTARAEQGCPPGQYPIGGQGVAACAPIPQGNAQQPAEPRPLGKWIKTWGAVAMGSLGLERNFGVTTGKLSKTEAESDALARCAKHGEKDCKIGLSYRNQCIAIGEPQINGKPNLVGNVQFFADQTIEKASASAQTACERRNPENQCKVIYTACSEPIFKSY
ncbi:DUF4189 domain-containing protein [Pseudomonas viridiflava]|uniref:DUF4189 domain-containing protein n=1 Tax=Pseudomonas viridiflava TaxID=33069 RepID=UPI001C3122E2|nr:DUF4189 domain-containing protein [Pseudomonas viridiflava]QXG50070.1 DUF4189 domain-containing protein [Pseudomonas viridiflava]